MVVIDAEEAELVEEMVEPEVDDEDVVEGGEDDEVVVECGIPKFGTVTTAAAAAMTMTTTIMMIAVDFPSPILELEICNNTQESHASYKSSENTSTIRLPR